jgi:histidyl-tRNA synthetase
MEERGLFPASLGTLDVLLGAADEARLGDALALATRLRAAGTRVDLQPDAVNPAKLRKQAEARGVRAAVWIEAEDRGVSRAWTRADQTTRRDLTDGALLALLAEQPEDGDGRR